MRVLGLESLGQFRVLGFGFCVDGSRDERLGFREFRGLGFGF